MLGHGQRGLAPVRTQAEAVNLPQDRRRRPPVRCGRACFDVYPVQLRGTPIVGDEVDGFPVGRPRQPGAGHAGTDVGVDRAADAPVPVGGDARLLARLAGGGEQPQAAQGRTPIFPLMADDGELLAVGRPAGGAEDAVAVRKLDRLGSPAPRGKSKCPYSFCARLHGRSTIREPAAVGRPIQEGIDQKVPIVT